MDQRQWTRRSLLGCAASALTVAATGCGSGSTGSGSGGSGGTLTVGVATDTSTLDPAACSPLLYCLGAYDALVDQTPQGEFKPDLATSWKFTDADHLTFEVTLRKGTHFTDGTEMDAEAVAASINSFPDVNGTQKDNFVPIDHVEAVGKYTVHIHYTDPVTEEFALFQLTAQSAVAQIIGPEGLADRKSLETTSDGIGPYKLDASATVSGSTYTFVPNGRYFNQDAIRYDKIVFKPIASNSSRLSSIQAGELDWAQNISSRDADTAEGAGLRVSEGTLGSLPTLVLADRASGPLANLRVRQAISHAIPRDDIVDAVYEGSATAMSSLVAEGVQGYNESNPDPYPYDPDKARSLLKQAGYGDGFTLAVLDDAYWDPNYALGQAISNALSEVGITLDLTTISAAAGTVTERIFSKEFPAYITGMSTFGTLSLAYTQLRPNSFANPFGLASDATLDRIVQEAALASTTEEQNSRMAEATARLDELAWAAPIALVPTIQATRTEVRKVPATFQGRELDPFSPDTDESWYTKDA